jgi:hypothetical protein
LIKNTFITSPKAKLFGLKLKVKMRSSKVMPLNKKTISITDGFLTPENYYEVTKVIR